MSSEYYLPGPKRSERVRQLFGRIAARYDLINDLQSAGLHRFWKSKMVRAAQVTSSDKVLDVCCGTGDIAALFARDASGVVGCDFTPEMLERAQKRDIPKVFWVQGDALSLPFPDDCFEVVTIAYGLRNLADFGCGVQELTRVLKPSGRLLILEFGKPENPLLRVGYFAYLRVVVPIFGLLFCGDAAAYSYIITSLREYPAQDAVSRLLTQNGCESVQVRNFAGGAMTLHIAQKSASLRQGDDITLKAGGLVSQ